MASILMDEQDPNLNKIGVHVNPVWREQAGFLIQAKVSDPESPFEYEQLWVRRLAPDKFEVCCIPFFLYGIALGDVVSAEAPNYILSSVSSPSTRVEFRAWFSTVYQVDERIALTDRAGELGCAIEWYSERLLGLSAPESVSAGQLEEALVAAEQQGLLTFEHSVIAGREAFGGG